MAMGVGARPAGMAILLIALSCLAWVAVEGIGRALPSGAYSPYQIVWTRYASHLLLLALVVGPRRGKGLLQTGHVGVQIGRGLLMVGMPVCFVLASSRLPAADVWAIFWVAPLLVMSLAGPILGERVGMRRWAVAIVACAGAVLMAGPDLGAVRWAAILPLGMAACFALYIVLTRALRTEDISANLCYTALAVLVPLGVVMPSTWRMPTMIDLSIMAAIGLLGLIFLWGLDRACEHALLGTLAPYLFLQPLLTTLIHALWLGEIPTVAALLGAAAVSGALLIGTATGSSPQPGPIEWVASPPAPAALPRSGGHRQAAE
jgi:drug/metabolite transporter (DMT)-like permease